MRRRGRFGWTASVLGPLCLLGLATVVPVRGQGGQETPKPPEANGKRPVERFTPRAPAIIPHPIYDMPCTACHKTEKSVAPAIPHPPYPNCQQCHIARTDTPLYRANHFADRVRGLRRKPAPEASPSPAPKPPLPKKKPTAAGKPGGVKRPAPSPPARKP
jgi:hypothetical protein